MRKSNGASLPLDHVRFSWGSPLQKWNMSRSITRSSKIFGKLTMSFLNASSSIPGFGWISVSATLSSEPMCQSDDEKNLQAKRWWADELLQLPSNWKTAVRIPSTPWKLLTHKVLLKTVVWKDETPSKNAAIQSNYLVSIWYLCYINFRVANCKWL